MLYIIYNYHLFDYIYGCDEVVMALSVLSISNGFWGHWAPPGTLHMWRPQQEESIAICYSKGTRLTQCGINDFKFVNLWKQPRILLPAPTSSLLHLIALNLDEFMPFYTMCAVS